MKQLKRRVFAAAITLIMVLSLAPVAHAATYTYAVEGGNLTFDPTTGTIIDCDNSVYSAEIPSEIYGVTVTAIGDKAFWGCGKLTKVVIPSTVTSIGARAFGSCSNLISIEIPDSVTELESNSFGSTYLNGMFGGCINLKEIVIPGSIEEIPDRAFTGCSSLKKVTLKEGVTTIKRGAFENCVALEEIVLPDSVTNIDYHTFDWCPRLTTVTFGTGIQYIADDAISGCEALSSIYFRGNAPGASDQMIDTFAPGFMIYYPEGASGWTTPTWNGYITKSYQLQPTQPTPPALVTAVPTSSTVYVNGAAVAFDAYNINGNNYFKLRDLAFILSGSEAQFEVLWDGAANSIRLTSGQGYTPVGGEMAAKGAINKVGKLTKSSVYLDGKQVSFTAYNIDGNNYFKLRDIGQAIDFSVEWNGAQKSVEIDTTRYYRPE